MKSRKGSLWEKFEINSYEQLMHQIKVSFWVFFCLVIIVMIAYFHNQASSVLQLSEMRTAYIQQYSDRVLFFPGQIRLILEELFNELQNIINTSIDAKDFTTSATLVNTLLNASFSTFLKKKDSRRHGIQLSSFAEYRILSAIAKVIRLLSVFVIAVSYCFLAYDLHIYAIIACIVNYWLTTVTIISNFAVYSDEFWLNAASKQYRNTLDNPDVWYKDIKEYIKEEDTFDEGKLEFILYVFKDANDYLMQMWSDGSLDLKRKKLLENCLRGFYSVIEHARNKGILERLRTSFDIKLENKIDYANLQVMLDVYTYLLLIRYVKMHFSHVDEKYKQILFSYLKRKTPVIDKKELYDFCKKELLEAYLAEPESMVRDVLISRGITNIINKDIYSDINNAFVRIHD